jgi:hypothetical protein
MKVIGKALAFIKENKIIVFALAIVLLSFVFLALPGQFAHYGILNLKSKVPSERFAYRLSGYEWMFATKENILGSKIGSVPAQGIAIFVMLILCVPGLLFSKKSSFVSLLTSLALITISVLFFTISAAGLKAYPAFLPAKNGEYSLMLWVPYVLGSLIVIAGLLMSYRTFKVMKDEVQHPTASTKGPSYNYLHK